MGYLHGMTDQDYKETLEEIKRSSFKKAIPDLLEAHAIRREIASLFEMDHVITPWELYEKAKIALQKAEYCCNKYHVEEKQGQLKESFFSRLKGFFIKSSILNSQEKA